MVDKVEDRIVEDVVKTYHKNAKSNNSLDIYSFFRSINEALQKDIDFCRKLLLSRRALNIVDKLNCFITNFLLNHPRIKKLLKTKDDMGHINASIELFVGGVCSAYITYIRGVTNYKLDDIAFCVDRYIKDLKQIDATRK